MDPFTLGAVCAGIAGLTGIEKKYKEHKAWKQKWRRLKDGMTINAVEQAIGEPKTIESQTGSTIYKYPLGGMAVFSKNRLVAWKEPAL